jgi:hypothetical protein
MLKMQKRRQMRSVVKLANCLIVQNVSKEDMEKLLVQVKKIKIFKRQLEQA